MESSAAEVVQRLRDAGLRVTAPRVAVLEVLAGHPHATADTVATLTRQRLGRVSTHLTPSDDAGYLLDEAEVVFRGLCPDCRTDRAGAPAPSSTRST
ncbi:hypothetical protein [Pseudonocardia sp.]|jgi:Fe2+ or Zn2+ uptake regulation protein|uniref:hypothetical protein n=1 Tax=Pseudonocardia sp. TaxID=60912 RepID=UPI0031FD3C53